MCFSDLVVVIGEGEKDEAPMLYNGETVGTGEGPACDVAVDPIDGTRLTAMGQPNALSVIALAERGSMFFPGAAVYMEKVATGPEAADAIDITASPEENVRLVAKAKGIKPEEVGVVILDRERHADMIARVREVGALAGRTWDRSVRSSIGEMFLGEVVLYAVAIPWLMRALDVSLGRALELGLAPFVVGDTLKLLAAAGLLPLAWRTVRQKT